MSDDAIKLSLINAALTHVGEPRVDQLDSGEEQTTAVEENYELIVEDELTAGPEWDFALKTAAPTLIGAYAHSDLYEYQWQLPSDFLDLREVYHRDVQTTAYDEEESKLLINANTDVLVRGIYRAGESVWHPAFKAGIKHRLEAVAIRAFVENDSLADRRDLKAEQKFARARAQQGHRRRARKSRPLRRRIYGRTTR